jgi:hypothetical protein
MAIVLAIGLFRCEGHERGREGGATDAACGGCVHRSSSVEESLRFVFVRRGSLAGGKPL